MGTSRKNKTVEDIEKQVEAEKKVDTKSRQIADRNRTTALALAKELTPEKVSADMTDLGLKLSRTLSEARQKVIEKLEEHDQIQTAIAAKKAELEGLFDKEVVAMDMAALVEDRAKLVQEIAELETKAEDRARDLERQQDLKKLEDDHALAVARAAEESEYVEKKRVERVAADQRYAEKHQLLATKEKEFEGKQKKYDELLKMEAEASGKLHAAVAVATRDATTSAQERAKAEFEIEKLKLTHETDVAVREKEAAEEKVTGLEAQIERLEDRVKEAQASLVSVATSGLSSFGSQASSALNGKGDPKGKAV